MNIDDPKLTAFALDELDEPERSTIAREVAQSLEAQRVVNETRELARGLKNDFAAELNEKAKPPLSLSDIRDDPWFWSTGRPLAIAAAVAVLALLGAIVVGRYSRNASATRLSADYVIEAEQSSPNQRIEPNAPDKIPNPLGRDAVQRIERVVVGELESDPHLENGELRLIETINDAYRIERLKERLRIPVVSKKSYRGVAGRGYELMFLDRAGHVIASAHFGRTPGSRFVLQPRSNAYERNGRYFVGGEAVLPGDWQSDVDYDAYIIDFPDWQESIGYSPGA